MAPLIDFLDPLHRGIWEVIVPKDAVTEPLEPAWVRSPINVPSPKTIASYRSGQYHAHETAVDYRVHLDRYDPARNPIMHLVDDAPLLLMIYETMATLVVTARDAEQRDLGTQQLDLRLNGGVRAILGLLLLCLGGLLLLMAFGPLELVFALIIPGVVFGAGAVLLLIGIRSRGKDRKNVLYGLGLLGAGWFLLVTWELYVVILLLVLAAWFLSSAAVTIRRIVRSRDNIPQGLLVTAGLGISSLAMGWLAFTNPVDLLEVLVLFLAVIISGAGGLRFLDGYGMPIAARLLATGPVSA